MDGSSGEVYPAQCEQLPGADSVPDMDIHRPGQERADLGRPVLGNFRDSPLGHHLPAVGPRLGAHLDQPIRLG